MVIFCMAPICAVEMNRDGGSNSENYMVESKDVEKDTTQQEFGSYTLLLSFIGCPYQRGEVVIIDIRTENYLTGTQCHFIALGEYPVHIDNGILFLCFKSCQKYIASIPNTIYSIVY